MPYSPLHEEREVILNKLFSLSGPARRLSGVELTSEVSINKRGSFQLLSVVCLISFKELQT